MASWATNNTILCLINQGCGHCVYLKVVSHIMFAFNSPHCCHNMKALVNKFFCLIQCNIAKFHIPGLRNDQTNLSVTLLYFLFHPSSSQDAVFCVQVSTYMIIRHYACNFFLSLQLPELCVFQTVRYTVVISHGGGLVQQLSRQFSYSSGYNSECIEEKVSGELEEGVEYEAQLPELCRREWELLFTPCHL